MLTRFICLFSLLLFCHSIQAQTAASHKTFIKRVTKQMAHAGVVDCQYIGRAATRSRQYIRFDSLREQCSSAELQALLSHKSPVVRAYAFQALAERPEVDLYPLLLQHRRDKEEFDRQCGCVTSTRTAVGSMLLDYRRSKQFAQDTLSAERKTTYRRMAYAWSRQQGRQQRREQRMSWAQRERLTRKDQQLTAHDKDDF